MPTATPIFVISYNRGAWLAKVADAYRRQSLPVEIVVHDNGSDDPDTLATLDALGRDGVDVVRNPPIATADDLNAVDRTVQAYFAGRPAQVPYVVTDCDVDLSAARPEALAVYHELLERFPDAACVGPMLRISDIPRSYPLFNRVMNRHIAQFWGRSPAWTTTSFGAVAYARGLIDTTFALHRAGEAFRRKKRGLRVYHPYEARHLDWYPGPETSEAYHRTSSPQISHWNNAEHQGVHAGDPLEAHSYVVVESDAMGNLLTRLKQPLIHNPR